MGQSYPLLDLSTPTLRCRPSYLQDGVIINTCVVSDYLKLDAALINLHSVRIEAGGGRQYSIGGEYCAAARMRVRTHADVGHQRSRIRIRVYSNCLTTGYSADSACWNYIKNKWESIRGQLWTWSKISVPISVSAGRYEHNALIHFCQNQSYSGFYSSLKFNHIDAVKLQILSDKFRQIIFLALTDLQKWITFKIVLLDAYIKYSVT